MSKRLSRFGIFCRKLRVEKCELLGDMADKFGVSSAFLSKVENGKAKPPIKWRDTLVTEYNLDNDAIEELDTALFEANNQNSIDISGFSDDDKDLMWSFARKFNSLDRTALKKILDKKE